MPDEDTYHYSSDSRRSIKDELRDIHEHRNVLWSLVRKNLIGRYKNSAFGFAWHFITPIIMLLVYYFAFNTFRESSIESFWLYLGVGLFPFNFMISNLVGGATCITNNAAMVNKMYFPREILVLAQTISTAIIMLLGLSVVIILMLCTGTVFNPWGVLVIIGITVLMFVFVNGYALLFSSLNVYKRDVQHFLSAVTIMFYFMSPMYFSVDQLSGYLKGVIWFNPFTYYLEAFHDVFYRGIVPPSNVLIGCTVFALIAFVIGALVFSRLKHGFSERL